MIQRTSPNWHVNWNTVLAPAHRWETSSFSAATACFLERAVFQTGTLGEKSYFLQTWLTDSRLPWQLWDNIEMGYWYWLKVHVPWNLPTRNSDRRLCPWCSKNKGVTVVPCPFLYRSCSMVRTWPRPGSFSAAYAWKRKRPAAPSTWCSSGSIPCLCQMGNLISWANNKRHFT